MKEQHDIHALCLEVFAGISATVSHDLKNTLATINENAGLLDDLACMAGEDTGVPTERVQAAAASIAVQVARSNTIIKNLNRFAHSGDSPVVQADIGEVLNLMVALTARKAAMRNISVTVECGEDQQVHTSLFHLESLIYLILAHLYGAVASGSTITLSSMQDAAGCVIRFAADLSGDLNRESFPGHREQALLHHLGGSWELSEDGVVLKLSAEAEVG